MGHEVPIVFSSLISHADIGGANWIKKVISAGFCEIMGIESTDTSLDTLEVWAGGKSVTLELKSREEDAVIIHKMLSPE